MTAVLEQLHRLAASMGGSRRSGQDQLASAVEEAISSTGRLVAEAGTGTGKALALDTSIPTPTGWVAMGDLRVGDVVFDETGAPCNVTHAHPVRNGRPCFEVEFSDGEVIIADEDHLWATATRAARRSQSRARSAARVSTGTTAVLERREADGAGPLEVITTRQMFDTLLTERGERNHAVPVAAALQMPDVELPIDPYLLGAWLGNGHSESGLITTGYHDRVAVAELVTPLWDGTVIEHADRSAVRFRFGQPNPGECPYGHSNWNQANTKVNRICATCTAEANGDKRDRTKRSNQGLTELLRLHGLYGNKHIPVLYARASVAQRLSLLQGLMDTDGFVDRRGFCEATFTRERLALDTVELIRSLGIKASIKSSPAAITENGTRRIVGTRWRIMFRPDVCVFRLPRKAARWHSASATRKASVGLFRYVVDVRPTASVPVRCITVDSASHLFLAGRAMVPTHNSFGYLVPAAMSGKRTLVITSGLALQDQIVGSDLPAIRRVLDPTLTFTSLKGRSNYACFDGGEMFVTKDGLRRFDETVGQRVQVLDGDRNWTEAEIKSFGRQRLWRLAVIRRGVRREILTTADHRWFVNANANFDAHTETITSELQPGDRLAHISVRSKVKGRIKPSPVGVCAGLVYGDGSRFQSTDGGIHKGACTIPLHGEKNINLLKWFDGIGSWGEPYERPTHAEPIVRVSNLPSFFKDRPSLDSNVSYLYGWLAGYFAADGTVGSTGAASISSANRSDLEFVMTVCERLGVSHAGRISEYDRVGMNSNGEASTLYTLPVFVTTLNPDFFLVEEHRRRVEACAPTYKRWRSTRRWKVESVEQLDEVREVYCAIVPTTASFALAGNILTGNCVQKAAEAIAFRTPALRSAAAWVLDDDSDGLKERRLAPAGTTDETWSALTIGHDECPGVKVCPSGKRCAAATARRVATDSRIVVANMHLLGAWLVNGELPEPKDANGDVLEGGRFEVVVVDEAHDLDDIACSANGSAVSGWMLRRVANDFAAAHLALPAADLRRLARVLDAECDRIGSQRFDSIGSASDFESILVEAASVLDEDDFPDGPAGQRMKAKAAALSQQLAAVVAADGDTDVIWCDGSAIHTQPRSVAGLLARNVWNQRAVVITSATMPRKIITDIGLKLRPRSEPVPEVAMLRCASPFDYRRQSVLYLPSGLPRPGTAHWDQAAGDECVRLVSASDGGALVLCTSMAAVARFADRLTAEGFRVHSQQPGSQKEALIKAFADDYNSVLVATRSFWQGVDVPGRSLRLVVIDRVPFPRPDEWVVDARRETAAHRMVVSAGLDWDEAKKQAFHHVDVPLAATALAQAAGRLIRSVSDTGVVAILDGRLETARYASAVLAALPPMWRTTDFEAVRSAMSKFAVAS